MRRRAEDYCNGGHVLDHREGVRREHKGKEIMRRGVERKRTRKEHVANLLLKRLGVLEDCPPRPLAAPRGH